MERAAHAVIAGHCGAVAAGVEEGEEVAVSEGRQVGVAVEDVERFVDMAGDGGRAQTRAWARCVHRHGHERKLVEGGFDVELEAAVHAGVESAPFALDGVDLKEEEAGVFHQVVAGFAPDFKSAPAELLRDECAPSRQIERSVRWDQWDSETAAEVYITQAGDLRDEGLTSRENLREHGELRSEVAAAGVKVNAFYDESVATSEAQSGRKLLSVDAELGAASAGVAEEPVAAIADPEARVDPQADPPAGRERADPRDVVERVEIEHETFVAEESVEIGVAQRGAGERNIFRRETARARAGHLGRRACVEAAGVESAQCAQERRMAVRLHRVENAEGQGAGGERGAHAI